ncbi:diacylglycerol kinase family lipid kinase [soil metagenome]
MRVILNPMARHGAGRRLRSSLESELERHRFDFDLVLTEGPGHAIELARDAVHSGVRRIIAAGGDGTVHEVVNGMVAAGPADSALGLIPIGTGNDFVKMVPGTSTREDAFITLASQHTSPMDVGVARWDDDRTEYFINAMGTGIDVEVVRQMRRSRWLPGGVIYVSALLRALARYRPATLDITVDGRSVRQRVMNLAVCNGPSIGGSFRICPDASPADGVLDICVVAEMPIWRNALMVPRVLKGTHVGQAGITMLRGTTVRLGLPDGGPLLFQLDGELREADDGAAGVKVLLAPARLNVITRAPAGAGVPKE